MSIHVFEGGKQLNRVLEPTQAGQYGPFSVCLDQRGQCEKGVISVTHRNGRRVITKPVQDNDGFIITSPGKLVTATVETTHLGIFRKRNNYQIFHSKD